MPPRLRLMIEGSFHPPTVVKRYNKPRIAARVPCEAAGLERESEAEAGLGLGLVLDMCRRPQASAVGHRASDNRSNSNSRD